MYTVNWGYRSRDRTILNNDRMQMRKQELLLRACTKFQAVLRRLRVEEAMKNFYVRWDHIEARDGGPSMWLDRITMEVFWVFSDTMLSICNRSHLP